MFGPVAPTRFDLGFPIAGIPVRVHPTFWLVAVLMGRDLFDRGEFDRLAAWIVCLFVSILIHELGHAFTALAFGWPPHVTLYYGGGLASYSPYHGYSTGRSIAISLAGPMAGFCFFAVILLIALLLDTRGIVPGPLANFTLAQLEWINLWWGLINLLPVLPLDGGRICEALCVRMSRRSGERLAAQISIVVGAAAAIGFFLLDRELHIGLFPTILFAFLCAQNIQTLQSSQGRRW